MSLVAKPWVLLIIDRTRRRFDEMTTHFSYLGNNMVTRWTRVHVSNTNMITYRGVLFRFHLMKTRLVTNLSHSMPNWNKRISRLIPRKQPQRLLYESAGAVASTSQSASQSTQSTSNSAAVSVAAALLNRIMDSIDLDGDTCECVYEPPFLEFSTMYQSNLISALR